MRAKTQVHEKSQVRISRTPDFLSGIIVEPMLAFGGHHEHVDPKTGLALYGPYTLSGQTRPALSSMIIGIVGPSDMVANAEYWLRFCRGAVTNEGKEPFLRPHFPGFNEQHPFQCEVVLGDAWREIIRANSYREALSVTNFYERIKRVAELYVAAIDILAGRDPKPQVILCCIPQDVIDFCTQRLQGDEQKRVKLSKAERNAIKIAHTGQLALWADMDPSGEGEHQNLRRAIKARAMQYDIPTQLVWPRTLDTTAITHPGERPLQDVATRAWNFMTALYHKAGGSPWRLADAEPGVCYVGVSFYKEIAERNPLLRTSMIQAFTAAGDGYVLRGNAFEWNEAEHGKSPHLDKKSAASLMRDVLDLYQRQNRGSLPTRLVVHKTSRYWEEELDGFEDATALVPRKDFIAIGGRGIQFYRPGNYPPLRGSFMKFSSTDFLLYTTGYVPYLRTYAGPRVPQPLEVLEHHGDVEWDIVLREILSLTKMNWNTADFACGKPITLAFSRRVGQILAELPPSIAPRAEYRFYM